MNLRDALAQAGVTDPQILELSVRVALDASQLQARATAGEDVQQEIAIVQATALNLSEHVRNLIGNWLLTAATSIAFRALGLPPIAPPTA
mgnify:FL=1